ncbi:MAG: aldolase/citrate lyase family protein [Hydrogenophaga sp.]|jgi:citrate lyase subunit beta/citryl-CoA lyase|uniref:HpcH/HpaI aldolase/citrate lyase family protein n=1 Tax=Hydrogenophaga sp. TaxID=1904254 RepID=UPI0027236526|nr:aldolase/citrate lyase family protein [Hydrogenophaga sp.]MDO9482055.1 aldolase/citrate lyase family protein [Hydrogenophaga sp.]MDP3344295.1 aldolase/citrate lyase family protein [Hydrogenophaga sp.]MDP3805909.1 aldolase/citrate lyase family protein [Hydrogenophaga sp.]MDP3923970.1 aldolase/citrate lyase family protein [Hydrogenophaga sp.]
MPHPRDILAGAQAGAFALPVCDHYSGVEARMRKSLQLQAEMTDELGACVFDVTLDCEDGAPVGGEVEHAALVTELVLAAQARARVAVRVHPVDHPHFDADVAFIAGRAAARLTHLMVPKVESVADVQRAVAALDAAGATALPLHVLIESPAAVHRAFDIAAHPRVQSLSFGLMDFVSAHGGAIPASAMGVVGQFGHPLVLRAKLDMASACHAHGKVPSHCVVTEFKDLSALKAAARKAANELGYTRMWSIHPDQIRAIVAAFAPNEGEVHDAACIIERAASTDWAPVQFEGRLHDRASYRYYWQLLERAHRTGVQLPEPVRRYFVSTATGTGAGRH